MIPRNSVLGRMILARLDKIDNISYTLWVAQGLSGNNNECGRYIAAWSNLKDFANKHILD